MLTFDPVEHVYRFDGVVVPSVTRILAPLIDLSRIPADTLEAARLEGVAIHAMAEAYFDGMWTVPEEWLKPKMEGLKRFVVDTGFECLASEHMMYHPLGYAGTVDLVGTFRDEKVRVIDLKRTLYGGRTVGLQLVAYSAAWIAETEMPVEERYALVLGDGDYKLMRYDDPMDWQAFQACLVMWKWRNNGRK